MVHTRWIDDAGWAKTREAFFGMLPVPLRWFVPALARRGLRAEMRGHGMGRHSVAEIHAIGCRDVTAVADFLANLLWAPVDSPIQRLARQRPTLEAYCQRMKVRYFA